MSAPDSGLNKRSADQALMDLAADVRGVRGTIAEVRDNVGEVAGVVAELAPQLAEVRGEVSELQGQVEELLKAPAEPTNPPIPWPALTAEDAQREWHALGQWVAEVLVPWYELTRGQLPDCWALHRPAMLQLSWLRTSYIEAFLPRSHPSQAAEWHTRWLSAALDNIATAIPTQFCRPGEHKVHEHVSAEQKRQNPPASGPGGGPQPWAQPRGPVPQPAAAYHQETERDQLADPQYWGPHFEKAMQQDIDERRRREAAQAQQNRQ